ncbi:hypothetical protein DAD186_02810 [Dermabacter vaginalis]|uniref:Uncharacterized protein n=1 Tax=Dermabacter vaginalis TaxID=1630135 RepID=A0A1B0ZFX3_9MICO|nr:hypothetical protein DAD186_02810 [Dermabacter vaginalis]
MVCSLMFVMVLVRVGAVGGPASNIPPRGIDFKGVWRLQSIDEADR